MRFINIEQLTRTTDFEALENACNEIMQLKTEKERKKYIDNNSALWTAVRDRYWMLGNMKCWYSEDIIQEGEGEIEHYRPKGKVCKSKHGGYWWKAFDWHNYRLVHRTCNIRREDYVSKKKAGKGAYFPLKDEKVRATNEGEIGNEEPVLLDPIKPADVRLLCFNLLTGKPEVSPVCGGDVWSKRRVYETIGYYHLDEGTWNKQRKDISKAVDVICKGIIAARQKNDLNQENNLVTDLKTNYTDEHLPFVTVALQTLRENGLLDVLV